MGHFLYSTIEIYYSTSTCDTYSLTRDVTRYDVINVFLVTACVSNTKTNNTLTDSASGGIHSIKMSTHPSGHWV